MTLDLPDPAEAVGARSSVIMAICQVRFEQSPVVSEKTTSLVFHDRLGGSSGAYPKIEEAEAVNQVTMTMGPAGPFSETKHLTGWQLSSEDDAWTVSLLPGSASLQTTAYNDWEDFSERFSALLDALGEVVAPALEQRLGLRYVDRLAGFGVESPMAWDQYISSSFLGPILIPGIGQSVQVAQQQLNLSAGNDIACIIRHGLAPPNDDGTHDYLFDCDVVRESGRPFDAAAIRRLVDSFKDQADRLFQAAALPLLLDRLVQ
jgi:uncharacterized protein (TIGR04255 family)